MGGTYAHSTTQSDHFQHTMDILLQQVINGLVLGSMYAIDGEYLEQTQREEALNDELLQKLAVRELDLRAAQRVKLRADLEKAGHVGAHLRPLVEKGVALLLRVLRAV